MHNADGSLRSKFEFKKDQGLYGVELLNNRILVSNHIPKPISLFDTSRNSHRSEERANCKRV